MTWLVEVILEKVDRSGMARGLEARPLFLDYRILELAASLPVDRKLKGFNSNHFL